MVSARLRDGFGWTNVRILDVSSRGLLIRSPNAPPRGAYVEVCKGPHRIVARVVWVNQDRFGVCAQDCIAVDAIAAGSAGSQEIANAGVQEPPRRRPPSAEEKLERSRKRAGVMQFAWIVGLGAAAGTVMFSVVRDSLSGPLSVVSAELAGKK